jgi:hypothetical protein
MKINIPHSTEKSHNLTADVGTETRSEFVRDTKEAKKTTICHIWEDFPEFSVYKGCKVP